MFFLVGGTFCQGAWMVAYIQRFENRLHYFSELKFCSHLADSHREQSELAMFFAFSAVNLLKFDHRERNEPK